MRLTEIIVLLLFLCNGKIMSQEISTDNVNMKAHFHYYYPDWCSDGWVIDEKELTPLMVEYEHKAVSRLIELGADVAVKDSRGRTPLMFQAIFGSPNTLKLLLDNGSNINERSDQGRTALHFAVNIRGNLENVKYLIDRGISLDTQDVYGMTALMYAVPTRNVQLIRVIIDAGADISLVTRYGLNNGNMPEPLDLRYWFYPFYKAEDIFIVDTDK
jgi:ankyrin repeat protein